jgi:hypothetical protein
MEKEEKRGFDMRRDSDNRRGSDKRRNAGGRSSVPMWVHITIVAVIAAVIVFSVYKLLKWNAGTVETEGVVEGDFEVEVLDQVFLLPEDQKALHEDDGKETILFLGNDILTYYGEDNPEGFIQQVEKKTGATCINGGFPGSCVALKNADFSDSYPLDAFSFYNVSKAIASRDFSLLQGFTGSFEDSSYYKHAQALEELDMNTVDTLVIFYDAQDYVNLRIGMNPDNDKDPVTYSGALNAGISALKEQYPFIRIVCLSFPMCYAYDSSGAPVSGDEYDFGNGRLTTYLQFMIDVSGATGVTFIDNYYGMMHDDKEWSWLLDHLHVTADCNEKMAGHFVSVIYPEGN